VALPPAADFNPVDTSSAMTPTIRSLQVTLRRLALLVPLIIPAFLAADDRPAPISGKRLQQTLAEKISWSTRNVPIGTQLADLQAQSGITILRDRRINPRTPVSADTGFVSRLDVLRQLAAKLPDSTVVPAEHYVLLGPAPSVRLLPVLHELSEAQQARWKRLAPSPGGHPTRLLTVSWKQLATPRDILTAAATESGIRIDNPQAIPHDVWNAAELPRMTFLELACLVLIQFDLYPVADPDSPRITITPISAAPPCELRHAIASRDKSAVMAEWNRRHPDLQVRWATSSATFTADLATHAEFRSLIADNTAESDSTALNTKPLTDSLRTRLFQLKAERATLAAVVESFRSNGVPIEIPGEMTPEIQKRLKTLIPLDQASRKLPGSEFFPALFKDHVQSVEVLDTKIILHP
jgi:hypothetical protein